RRGPGLVLRPADAGRGTGRLAVPLPPGPPGGDRRRRRAAPSGPVTAGDGTRSTRRGSRRRRGDRRTIDSLRPPRVIATVERAVGCARRRGAAVPRPADPGRGCGFMSERSERIIRLSAVVPHGGTERSGVAA